MTSQPPPGAAWDPAAFDISARPSPPAPSAPPPLPGAPAIPPPPGYAWAPGSAPAPAYPPPAAAAIPSIPAAAEFYMVDSRRAGFAELRRDTGSLLMPLICKVLRVRLPGAMDDPNVESLRPFELPPGQFL